MKILISGGEGFIGTNYVLHLLKQGHQVLVLDKLTYAANEYLDYSTDQCQILQYDICDILEPRIQKFLQDFNPDYIVHMAAESMVDRSLENNKVFFETNVMGTWALLETIKRLNIKKAVFFSTDEVYGSLRTISPEKLADFSFGFDANQKLDPHNPYASSKAAADQLTIGYIHNFNLPICLIRPTNNYGPFQHVEKLVPKAITNIFDGKKVPIYATGSNYREWLYVEDTCKAVDLLLDKGVVGQAYNVGSGSRHTNNQVIEIICKILNKNPSDVIEYVANRHGHDFAYGVDSRPIRELGWAPTKDLPTGMSDTIAHYRGFPDAKY